MGQEVSLWGSQVHGVEEQDTVKVVAASVVLSTGDVGEPWGLSALRLLIA